MNRLKMIGLLLFLSFGYCSLQAQSSSEKAVEVKLVWNVPALNGSVEISHGTLQRLSVAVGKGKVRGNQFSISGKEGKLLLSIVNTNMKPGPEPTVIHVKSGVGSFSFFLRDVNDDYPVYIPSCHVAVLPGSDARNYQDVERDVLNRKTQTKLQRIEKEEEASFETAATVTRNMSVPIKLGLGRDMRMFEISEELQDMAQEGKIIRPKYSSSAVKLPDTKQDAAYLYALGRGVGVRNNITRRLEEGALPVYHSELTDDDVIYHTVSFVSFARKALTEATNTGTNYIVSDRHSSGRTFKEEHLKELEERMKTAYDFDDQMVYYARTTIENKGKAPRYAWMKVPRPGTGWWGKKIHSYDSNTGFSSFGEDRIFCVSQLNGKPLPNEELAILLTPGEKAELDFFLPHTPISAKEADALVKQSFSGRLMEVDTYWKNKLASAAAIHLPDKEIDERVRAGLLHLNLITFGNEPDGTLAANVGVYSPIGTESSPIIQFYLSMGWFDIAKRALNYFLETQLSSGYIQNYEGYTIETGAALWSMGEYYRYTKDAAWIRDKKEKLLKSCHYLINWRNKNKKDELKGRGYGMIDGKVADPEDQFHQFMLNGYGYLGLSRIAEAMKDIDVSEHQRLKTEAEAWKKDIRESFFNAMAYSPVVPLGDGTWCPTVPPWTEADGLRAMYMKKEIYWSHGTFTAPDAMLGPLYLVFCEVLNPDEAASVNMLRYHSELFYQGNSAFSQPYYSRHNWLQARLGMVKPFLNTYYYTLAAHTDRQTYTFWEHMYRVSPNKTHEEAWFLMETRWMLYMEQGDTLNLFKTIPRQWLKDGQTISVKGAQSYFGKLNVNAVSHIGENYMEAMVSGGFNTIPKTVTIRLPHPEAKKPSKVTGGVYDPETETVIINNFAGEAKIRVEY